jgi:hypothetical protein
MPRIVLELKLRGIYHFFGYLKRTFVIDTDFGND